MAQYDRDHEHNVVHKYGMDVRPGKDCYVMGKPNWYNQFSMNNDQPPLYPLEYEASVDIRMRRSSFERLCQDADRFLELWDFLRDNPDAESDFYKWRMWQRLKA